MANDQIRGSWGLLKVRVGGGRRCGGRRIRKVLAVTRNGNGENQFSQGESGVKGQAGRQAGYEGAI